ncbi:transaldolase [Pararhizobium sp. DWP1-1-3]|uniref:transaldolase n=1 Tax=Pararhizobium sp. DWP1-1-3 TaxID=2804652 RepID=UPI003CEF8C79
MSAYENLAKAGVAVWLDDLSRERITSGSLAQMVDRKEIVGITTNPTIFAKSISAGSGYDGQIRELALRGTAVGEALRLITGRDVRDACDALRPAFEASQFRDGRVSIEVDPRISADAERTAAEARGLWWLIDRPNLFIKIPATRAALPAITAAISDGISVNVTLIFSVERYGAVLDAFMLGLEQRLSNGGSLAGVESVASFFISRVDIEVDRRLSELGFSEDADDLLRRAELHGEVAIANARLAYEIYETARTSGRWQNLASHGASLQRLLWASTGVKDNTLPATHYVTELVARDTVNTMPQATLEAVGLYSAPTPDRIRNQYDEARLVVGNLANLGIDLEDIAEALERDGISAFKKCWAELVKSVEDQLTDNGADVTDEGAVKPAQGDSTTASPAAAAPAGTEKRVGEPRS